MGPSALVALALVLAPLGARGETLGLKLGRMIDAALPAQSPGDGRVLKESPGKQFGDLLDKTIHDNNHGYKASHVAAGLQKEFSTAKMATQEQLKGAGYKAKRYAKSGARQLQNAKHAHGQAAYQMGQLCHQHPDKRILHDIQKWVVGPKVQGVVHTNSGKADSIQKQVIDEVTKWGGALCQIVTNGPGDVCEQIAHGVASAAAGMAELVFGESSPLHLLGLEEHLADGGQPLGHPVLVHRGWIRALAAAPGAAAALLAATGVAIMGAAAARALIPRVRCGGGGAAGMGGDAKLAVPERPEEARAMLVESTDVL